MEGKSARKRRPVRAGWRAYQDGASAPTQNRRRLRQDLTTPGSAADELTPAEAGRSIISSPSGSENQSASVFSNHGLPISVTKAKGSVSAFSMRHMPSWSDPMQSSRLILHPTICRMALGCGLYLHQQALMPARRRDARGASFRRLNPGQAKTAQVPAPATMMTRASKTTALNVDIGIWITSPSHLGDACKAKLAIDKGEDR